MSEFNLSAYDKLTPVQKQFLDALFECEGDEGLACKKIGIPTIKMTEELANAIRDKGVLMIAQEVPRALANLRAVLKGDPRTIITAMHRIKAAESLLDRAGLSKVERVQITSDQNSLVILPAKKPTV